MGQKVTPVKLEFPVIMVPFSGKNKGGKKKENAHKVKTGT